MDITNTDNRWLGDNTVDRVLKLFNDYYRSQTSSLTLVSESFILFNNHINL